MANKKDDKYDRFSSAGGVAKAGSKSPYANLTKKNVKKPASKSSGKKVK